MLQVDLRELARGPVETQGQLAGNDPLFEGLDVVLAGARGDRDRSPARGAGGADARRAPVGGVPGRLPRPVPALRQRFERRPVWLPTGRGPALEGAGRSQRQAPRLKRTITWPYRNEGLPSGRSVRAARTIRRPRSRSNPVRAAAT